LAKSYNFSIKHQVGDEALAKKTGRTWEEWFAILDNAHAHKMIHSDIATFLNEKLNVPGWWCQMIAVGYEQARGLRQKHERPDGFEISVTKVIPVPLGNAFRQWLDEKKRALWLDEENLTVRKATANKSIRFNWSDGKMILAVNFYPKGEAKTQVAVQHMKLPNATQAERMKKFWKNALERLASIN